MTAPLDPAPETTTSPSAPEGDEVIAIHGLAKTFRLGFFRKRVDAVRNATFTVHRGEVFGLIGHNGAGKTTTMKMMLGLIRPDQGHGTILGTSIRDSRSRLKVGFLPETPHFYDYLKPAELLDYFGHLYGMDRHTCRKRIPELLERVGLTGAQDKQLRKFSKGMLQRVGLAQALLPDSEIVVLDEPQSGLDPLGRKDVRDIIVSLKDEGKTVLFSSHVLPDVEHVCDRVALMVQGKVTMTGRLHDLLADGDEHVEVVLDGTGRPEPTWPMAAKSTAPLPAGRTRFTFADAGAATVAVRVAIDAGWSVVSVTPHRRSLEDLFVEQTTAGRS
jgi:ABC-2 type transport system ATP-binding protein